MPESVDPVPPPPSSDPTPSTTPGTLGLQTNVAAALACVPLIGGIIFYVMEKRDPFVRFYAMQSIIFGGAWCLFYIISMIIHLIFSSVPIVGVFLSLLWGLITMLIHLPFLIIWVVAT